MVIFPVTHGKNDGNYDGANEGNIIADVWWKYDGNNDGNNVIYIYISW